MRAIPTECDVIVLGLGPTGLFASTYLARLGHRVIAIEKHSSLFGLPRAGHVDHEIVRFLQELGVEQPFLEDAFPVSSYRWYNAEGDVLLEMDWGGQSASGYNSDYMMYQPVLENAVVSAMDKASDRISIQRNLYVTNVGQDADGVNGPSGGNARAMRYETAKSAARPVIVSGCFPGIRPMTRSRRWSSTRSSDFRRPFAISLGASPSS